MAPRAGLGTGEEMFLVCAGIRTLDRPSHTLDTTLTVHLSSI
jgi:hypothetical protein